MVSVVERLVGRGCWPFMYVSWARQVRQSSIQGEIWWWRDFIWEGSDHRLQSLWSLGRWANFQVSIGHHIWGRWISEGQWSLHWVLNILTKLVEEVSDCFCGCCSSDSNSGKQIDQKLWAVIVSASGGIIWWCHGDDLNLEFYRMQSSKPQSRWLLSDHLWGTGGRV